MRRHFLVVPNTHAGVPRRSYLRAVEAALLRAGAVVTILPEMRLQDVAELVRPAALSGSLDAVVAAGGDGTARATASALIGTGVPLGLVPLGTGNVLAAEIGLRRHVDSVAAALLHGPARRIRTALANGEPFLLMAGAGFDGRVIARLHGGTKQRFGKIAYIDPLLNTLVRPMDELEVSIDGGAPECVNWVVVANARHYGGRFILAPRTRIDEPGLQAVLFCAHSRFQFWRQLLALISGRLEARARLAGDVRMVPCQQVTIRSLQPLPVQLDGDAFGTTPLNVDAAGPELDLLMP